MNNTIIITAGIILLFGLVAGRAVKYLKMPNVTGYLIAGLIIGPCVLNWIPQNMVENFSVISDMALGFIAFTIGCEFKKSYFKQVGWTPVVIACLESLGAIIFVTLTCIIFGFDFKLSLLLGAIAAATAPAQTIMVINQYKAKGPLTSMLMSVVAIDDATALIGFGFAATIVKTMASGGGFSFFSILKPFYEIIMSVIIGGIMALVMIIFLRFFKKHSNRICVILGIVFLNIYAANFVKASALMACMALGAVLVNFSDETEDVIKVTDSFTPPLFMIFLVISGAGFDVSAVKSIGVIGIIYVVMRVAGKFVGSFVGAKIMKTDSNIAKYLGPTLMPQAGVALGLVVAAESLVPEYAGMLRVIILCSTFIYSIFGPIVSKWALVKAGEIKTDK